MLDNAFLRINSGVDFFYEAVFFFGFLLLFFCFYFVFVFVFVFVFDCVVNRKAVYKYFPRVCTLVKNISLKHLDYQYCKGNVLKADETWSFSKAALYKYIS